MRLAITRALLLVEEETADGWGDRTAGGAGIGEGGSGGDGGGGGGGEGGVPISHKPTVKGGSGGGSEPPCQPRQRLHPMFGSSVMRELSHHVDNLLAQCGAMERIRGTKLPIVYVSHLRTFLAGPDCLPIVYRCTQFMTVCP
jgi:hypothetical protein